MMQPQQLNTIERCPYCDDEGRLDVILPKNSYQSESWYVGCTSCGATGPISDEGPEVAILKWNTRQDRYNEAGILRHDNRRMAIQNETMDIALHQIIRWCDSYPTDVFGEPDIERARKLLEDGGMTLDSISAVAVRRVVSAIRGYAQAALFTKDSEE